MLAQPNLHMHIRISQLVVVQWGGGHFNKTEDLNRLAVDYSVKSTQSKLIIDHW